MVGGLLHKISILVSGSVTLASVTRSRLASSVIGLVFETQDAITCSI